jgi:hypothetical protein
MSDLEQTQSEPKPNPNRKNAAWALPATSWRWRVWWCRSGISWGH